MQAPPPAAAGGVANDATNELPYGRLCGWMFSVVTYGSRGGRGMVVMLDLDGGLVMVVVARLINGFSESASL